MEQTWSVFDTIDSLNNAYVKVWEESCEIESPSSDPAAVNRVADYFCAMAESLGWSVERYPQQGFGDVACITINAHATKAPIALSGHMDTVHPIGLFGSPAVRIEGDRIYGPGVMDCKGGIVAGFLAMHALKLCGYVDRPVMMLLQSNEEIGSGVNNKAPIRCICEKAKNAVAFLNLEGYEQSFKGNACLVRKGIVGFRFRVHGVAAHSSFCAREGASAIAEAAHKILELEKVKNDAGITVNIGKIMGGTARNTVPELCEFEVDCRYGRAEELEEIKSLVKRVAEHSIHPACTCEVELVNLRAPMELCEKNIALLERSNKAFAQGGLSLWACGSRNGASDASDVTACGIPCMDSMGVAGGRAHSNEEYGELASLAQSAKRIAAIVCGL